MDLVIREYRNFRGIDIVSMDPSILPSLFTEQTRHWRSFALHYLFSVIEHMHEYINHMLRVV